MVTLMLGLESERIKRASLSRPLFCSKIEKKTLLVNMIVKVHRLIPIKTVQNLVLESNISYTANNGYLTFSRI